MGSNPDAWTSESEMRHQDTRGRVTAQLSGCFPAHRLYVFLSAVSFKDPKTWRMQSSDESPVASISTVKLHPCEQTTILEKALCRVGYRAWCASGDDFIEFRPSGCRNQALVGGICAAIPLAGTFHSPQQRAEGKHSKRMKCTKVVKKQFLLFVLFCRTYWAAGTIPSLSFKRR